MITKAFRKDLPHLQGTRHRFVLVLAEVITVASSLFQEWKEAMLERLVAIMRYSFRYFPMNILCLW